MTPAWLSEVLGADVRKCRLEQIGIGVGLLGRLYRAHLEGGPDVPKSVVVKFPTLDTRARSAICEDLEFYLREVRFYQEIGLANPLPPARPYFAAFDETTHDFVLVLEDLGRLRVADQIVGCSAADAETVIDAVARHHAHWWDSDRFASLPMAEDIRHTPVRAGYGRQFRGRLAALSSRESAPTCPPSCVSSASGSRRWCRGSATSSRDRRTPSCTATYGSTSCSSPSAATIHR